MQGLVPYVSPTNMDVLTGVPTAIRPATLALMSHPGLRALCLSEVRMNPWCEGRRLPTGMAKLNTDYCLVCMCEFDDTLQGRNLAIRPQTLNK